MPEKKKSATKEKLVAPKKQKTNTDSTGVETSLSVETQLTSDAQNPTSIPGSDMPKLPKSKSDRNILFLGAGLIAVGLLLFFGRLLSVPFGSFIWPFIFILPGMLVLISALSTESSSGEGLSILGAILTSLGLIFLFQQISGLWATWAYAWAFIAPTSVGIAQILYGNRQKREKISLAGKKLVNIGLLMTGIGFIFFELILGISNLGGDYLDGFRLPLGLILIGLFVLARSIINRGK